MNGTDIQMLPAPPEALPIIPEIFRWGIEVITFIQRIESPTLTSVMKFITALGSEMLYIPMVLFIFWWIDEQRGLRLGILILVSAWINVFTKDLFKQPRPFVFEPTLALANETSYGAPSGHAKISLCFWVPMAAWLSGFFEKPDIRRKVIWIAAVSFILLISFTRLYLGVHFPTDLLLGWLIGGIILLLYFTAAPRLENLLDAAGRRYQNIVAALIALTMNGLYPADRSLPAIFLGFCLGYVLMKKYCPFSASGEINGKKPGLPVMLGRCLTGFAGIAIIFFGLRFLHQYDLGRFISFGLLGLWASAGAPWVFARLRLASR